MSAIETLSDIGARRILTALSDLERAKTIPTRAADYFRLVLLSGVQYEQVRWLCWDDLRADSDGLQIKYLHAYDTVRVRQAADAGNLGILEAEDIDCAALYRWAPLNGGAASIIARRAQENNLRYSPFLFPSPSEPEISRGMKAKALRHRAKFERTAVNVHVTPENAVRMLGDFPHSPMSFPKRAWAALVNALNWGGFTPSHLAMWMWPRLVGDARVGPISALGEEILCSPVKSVA